MRKLATTKTVVGEMMIVAKLSIAPMIIASLVVSSTLLNVAPCVALSQQKGSGVAGGSRVARGNSPSSPRVSPRNTESSDDEAVAALPRERIREIESLEHQCLDEVNRVRRRSGLARLVFYDELLPVARAYSRRMAEQHFFSHDDPEGRTVRERVDQADIRWRMIGENLAFSSGYVNPVAASLHGWMESPGHRRNILEPDFNLTAVGVWITSDGTVYFTEIFLRQ